MQVVDLYRYPVKGLSPEPLQDISLQVGRGVENDRRFALALPKTKFDAANPHPVPKTGFLMLARYERLAALQTIFDDREEALTIRSGGRIAATGTLTTDEGRAQIEEYFDGLFGREIGGRPRLVEGRGHRFTDVSVISSEMMEAVSVINLASVRELANAVGVPLHPLRFRANIYIDGLAPWAELDWVGREMEIGDVRCVGALLTPRCPATEVNPETASRDVRVPRELSQRYGHLNMGIYATISHGGTVRRGDVVRLL